MPKTAVLARRIAAQQQLVRRLEAENQALHVRLCTIGLLLRSVVSCMRLHTGSMLACMQSTAQR